MWEIPHKETTTTIRNTVKIASLESLTKPIRIFIRKKIYNNNYVCWQLKQCKLCAKKDGAKKCGRDWLHAKPYLEQ